MHIEDKLDFCKRIVMRMFRRVSALADSDPKLVINAILLNINILPPPQFNRKKSTKNLQSNCLIRMFET